MQIETVSGKLIDPVNPDPKQIIIEDIAWGLSRISRFAGHTITAVPYTVSQHSVYVADLVKQIIEKPGAFAGLEDFIPDCTFSAQTIDKGITGGRWAVILKGLVHDGSEAYTGDIISPIKKIPELRPIIKGIEHGLMTAIYTSIGLEEATPLEEGIINYADKLAQRIEAYQFMPSRGRDWVGLPEASIILIQKFPEPQPALDSYKNFMEFYEHYLHEYREQTNVEYGIAA